MATASSDTAIRNDIAIRSDTAIRSDIAIAVAFMHAQWLSSVQKRRSGRASVLNRRTIRAGVQNHRTNRAVHLGKSQTRQPRLTFSQF